jgi:hypothetical protein
MATSATEEKKKRGEDDVTVCENISPALFFRNIQEPTFCVCVCVEIRSH